MHSAEQIARELGGRKAKPHSNGWWDTVCVCHGDERASLGLTDKYGKIEVKCQAGCEAASIKRALRSRGFVLEPKVAEIEDKRKGKRLVIAYYEYTNGVGDKLFRVARTEPKGFFQQSWDDNLGWQNKGPKHRTLFRLPEVLEAKEKGDPIYYVEGEKDALTLAAKGLCATTAAGGCKAPWQGTYTESLRGAADVYVIPDMDKPGYDRGVEVTQTLANAGINARLVLLPTKFNELPVKDVTDYFQAGGTAEAFDDLCKSAPRYDETNGAAVTFPGIYIDTDDANAHRLVSLYGNELLYSPAMKSWYGWGGKRWEPGDDEIVFRFAREVGRKLAEEAAATASPELYKWARQTQSLMRIKSMVKLAESDERIKVHADDFDSYPMYLNCLNGVLNLETGELMPHDRKYRLTRLANVEYDRNAKCPQFEQFIKDSVPEAELELLQTAAGYSLTGATDSQVMFFIKGPTRSGKGTFVYLMEQILGGYRHSLDAAALCQNNDNFNVREQLSNLVGARMVITSESSSNHLFDAQNLKRITGQDTLSARPMRKSSYDFTPQFKLWVQTNEYPELPADDDAVWERVRIINFPNHVTLPMRDPYLKAKLRTELPGILNWLIKGAIRWKEQGIQPSEEMLAHLAEYRADVDKIAQWMDDAVITEEGAELKTSYAHRSYVLWAKDHNIRHVESINTFSRRMTKKVGLTKRKNDGRYFQNIALKPEVIERLEAQVKRRGRYYDVT